jgi:thioredoxin-related protein
LRFGTSRFMATAVLLACALAVLAFKSIDERREMHSYQLDVPGYSWQDSRATLVIAVRYGCHFCEASLPFYKRLMEASNGVSANKLRIAFISPDNEYLAAHILPSWAPMDTVRSNVFFPPWITGTPTMILMDNKGKVDKVWVGVLNISQQRDVIDVVRQAN